MATIEERAERYHNMWMYGKFNECIDALRSIATEQDRVARQEEREKAWAIFSELIDTCEGEGYCEKFLITKDEFFDEMEGGDQ